MPYVILAWNVNITSALCKHTPYSECIMPSSSLQLALIALWVAKPSLLWLNATWQSLTGITGEPWDYDSEADLEARATNVEEWTVAQAKTVKEFMVSCKETSGTDECHVDSKGNSHSEGRTLWNTWIKAHWCKTWKVNKMIDQVFDLESCSPHTVLARHIISDPAQVRMSHIKGRRGSSVIDRGPASFRRSKKHRLRQQFRSTWRLQCSATRHLSPATF
jgi:hypothetical protein